jgi:hypothetical protein
MATQTAQKRRIPHRNRITPDEAIAAIKAHAGQLSLAGEALGCSRQSVEQMCRRYPRVKRAARDAEQRMTDIATVQMHKLVLEKDFRACAYWLDRSPLARARGWGPQGSEFNAGDQPRQVANILIEFVSREQIEAERAAKTIEHRELEDGRAEDSLAVDHDTRTEDVE